MIKTLLFKLYQEFGIFSYALDSLAIIISDIHIRQINLIYILLGFESLHFVYADNRNIRVLYCLSLDPFRSLDL